jgi:hypothetical protein
MSFTRWYDGRRPGAPYDHASPNLLAIRDYLIERWDLSNLGCYGVRKMRDSTAWSAHAFGAAQDCGYAAHNRPTVQYEVLPFLVEHAATLGIQRIHDYIDNRYWQIGAGWIKFRGAQTRGYWIHIETNAEQWDNDASVEERIGAAALSKPLEHWWVKLGDEGDQVRQIQQVLHDAGYKNSSNKKPLLIDGIFGANTNRRVRQYQSTNGLTVDGIVGPKTAKHMGLL